MQDKKADLVISTYVDAVLEKVCKNLGVEILEYLADEDPTKQSDPPEWTIQPDWIKDVEKRYTAKLKSYRDSTSRKRKSESNQVDKQESLVVPDKKKQQQGKEEIRPTD